MDISPGGRVFLQDALLRPHEKEIVVWHPVPRVTNPMKMLDKEKTILFAEPVETTSLELKSLLAERGERPVFAKTLKETLLTLQSEPVDVLVLDAALLEEDCGFISVIRGIEKELPIIVCAETNTPEMESKIRQQRIFYYHIKSFGTQDLVMAISNAVNGLAR